jgi:small subunit ribosomal protein S1
MADTSVAQGPEALLSVALEGHQTSESTPSQAEDKGLSTSAPQAAEAGEGLPSAAVSEAEAHENQGDKAASQIATSAVPDEEAVNQGESSDQSAAPEATTSQPGDGDAPGADTAAGENAGARKRKRRKRHKAENATAEGAPEEGAEGAAGKPKHKDGSTAPFARFLSGAANARRHAFAVGEEVAGRVVRCERGAIIVDLFGKATAIADEFEPREIPPLREEEAPASVSSDQAAAPAEGEAVQASGAVESGHGSAVEPALPSAEDQPSAHVETSSQAAEVSVATQEQKAAYVEQLPHETEEPPSAQDTHAASAEQFPEHDAGDLDDTDDSHEPASHEPPSQVALAPVEPGKVFKGRIGAIAESGHVALINRYINVDATIAAIEKFREERKRVQGVVFGFNRGGFDVIVEGIRAFCPASGMSFEEIDDPRLFVGQKLDFTLPPIKGSSKDLVVTRRSILEKERRKRVKELIRSLKPGQKIKGRVTQVRDYGLFVDIGGFEGLVHQSELSFIFGVKPHEVAQVGDEVDVQVVDVVSDGDGNKRDRNTRVSLSIKALLDDPWDLHPEAVAEGTVKAGKVTRTTDFGAFVELAPAVEGLLRINELGRELTHANQAVKEGEEVYVVIERVDRHARRISLSKLSDSAVQDFKEGKLNDPSQRQPSLHPGARVMVKVESVEHRGLVVRVIGAAGKRARAFVPSNETGTERGTDLRKSFPRNSEMEVKILGVERDGSLKCSRKALAVDDERRAIKEYRREAASQGLGTFGDLLRAKLGTPSR